MSSRSAQEEISVKELMVLFLRLWNKIVQLFLRVILFVIKHAIPLVLLIAIGVGVAYFYKDLNPRYKRSFIISATEYSGEFLMQEFNEINASFATNNEELKKSMSLQDIDFNGIHYSVKPIFDKGISMDKEEYQYLNYVIENKLIDKVNLEHIIAFSNHSYEVEMVYPRKIDGLHIFNTTLDYLRNNEYASQLHQAILTDMNMQIEENNKMLVALGNYVSGLSEEGQPISPNVETLVVEGSRGSDIGAMLYARIELQKINKKLTARKVQLDQNFRVLNHSSAVRFYGNGIMSKKALIYPILLVSAYLFIIFVIFIIRAALALKEELEIKEG